jgi:hypothetical protein
VSTIHLADVFKSRFYEFTSLVGGAGNFRNVFVVFEVDKLRVY